MNLNDLFKEEWISDRKTDRELESQKTLISDKTFLIMMIVIVVLFVGSIAMAVHVYARSIASISVITALHNVNSVQSGLVNSGLPYSKTVNELMLAGLGRTWPAEVRVIANCNSGYIISASAPGVHKLYLTSESPKLTPYDDMLLPSCITPEMLGKTSKVPSAVPTLTAVRVQIARDALSEGVHLKWGSVAISCNTIQKPIYSVMVSNVIAWSQSQRYFVTQKTFLDIPSIWNGSSYTIIVTARCSTNEPSGDPIELQYSQSLPDPVFMSVSRKWLDRGRLLLDYTRVSSSPLVDYYSEFNKGNGWQPLITLKEASFLFYPGDYRYGLHDTFRVRAEGDSGFTTNYTEPVKATIVR